MSELSFTCLKIIERLKNLSFFQQKRIMKVKEFIELWFSCFDDKMKSVVVNEHMEIKNSLN
jgi:hypothetical protein